MLFGRFFVYLKQICVLILNNCKACQVLMPHDGPKEDLGGLELEIQDNSDRP